MVVLIPGDVWNCPVGLARLPLVNSYARTQPVVWKMGWMPSPSGDLNTHLPPIPLDYLQEKEVLKESIFRLNTIGMSRFVCLPRPHLQSLSANV